MPASMKTVAILFLTFFLLLCLLLYAGDYALLRYRVSRSRAPLGTVEMQPYYAVPQKDGKTEFMFLKPEDQVCVHSLFPHLGHAPCWYLNRYRNKQINI